MRGAAQSATQQTTTCVNAVAANPTYQSVIWRLAKPPMPNARPALERIADPDRASPDEARLLVPYFDDVSACFNQLAAAYDGIDPSQAAVIRGFVVESAKRMLALIRREITWGEANQLTDAAILALLNDVRENDRRTHARLEAMHASELANRQAAFAALSAAGAAMQQAAIQQQMLSAVQQSAVRRPSTTNCFRTGNVVNCNIF